MANPAIEALPLCEQYRDQFPVRDHLVYLNHAAVTPLCRRAAEAMKWLADDAANYGSLHYDRWEAVWSGLRDAAARLMNGAAEDIALVKNTSEGIAAVATGFDWRPGDRMVAFAEEFPANFYPWKILESAGVGVEWLSVTDPLDRIDAACRGARLLAISYVQYLSGHRVDLEALGEICGRRGCFFFVDAIQGLGAFPIDVARSNVAGLAADGHKWLLGPEGCGVLHIRADLRERVRPVEFGYTNVARYSDYGTRDLTLRPDAGRYECGTLNTIGIYGLEAAIRFLLEVGVDRIAPAVQSLADRIAHGAARKDYQILGKRTPETAAGIVSFRKPGVDSAELVRRLRARGFATAHRSGWVRTSPHFYIPAEDVERFLAELP